MALTSKQFQFVLEYRKDRDGTKAAIRAGFSERSAGQIAFSLLKNPAVQDALEQLDKEMADKIAVDTQRLVTWLVKIVQNCMQERQAVVKGVELPFAVFDAENAIKAIDRLREYTGGFPGADAAPLTGGTVSRGSEENLDDVGRVLRAMSNTDLARLEAELRAKNAKKLSKST